MSSLTLRLTQMKKVYSSYNQDKREEAVLCDFSEIELSNTMAASILRAAADEIDPQPPPSQRRPGLDMFESGVRA
jgi:hypothetical protein